VTLSEEDTKHRAACLRQLSFLFLSRCHGLDVADTPTWLWRGKP